MSGAMEYPLFQELQVEYRRLWLIETGDYFVALVPGVPR